MTNLLIAIALGCNFGGLFLINKYKTSLSNDALLEFEKNIKPVFTKFYLFGFIPILFLLAFLLNEGLEALNYFWEIITVMALLDGLTIFKLKSAIQQSKFKEPLSRMNIYYSVLLGSKILLMTIMKLKIDALLLTTE